MVPRHWAFKKGGATPLGFGKMSATPLGLVFTAQNGLLASLPAAQYVFWSTSQ